MAYTVGSASVDIVPDFKNAQLAITAFFNKQRDGIKIPVKLDIDQAGSGNVEQQARVVGSRVSKAMAEGMARNQAAADRLALQMAEGAEKSKLRAHAEALRINAQMDRDAARVKLQMDRESAKATKALLDEENRARIEASRLAEQMSEGRSQALLRAHAEALRLNAEFDRAQARSAALAIKTAERVAAEKLRIDRDAEKVREREQARALKEEEQFGVRSAKATMQAINRAIKEDAKNKIQIEIDQRRAEIEARAAGGIIARSVRHEIHQNAGLIGAAIAGVLAVGAPAALGAASALFIGIGAVAAAQSQRVRSAWLGTWTEIRNGAVSDAAVLVPVFERTAGAIAKAFQGMRPALRDAFTAVGPQIDSFTGRLINAAENALPGLVRAVQNAGPAVTGLGQLFEKTGTGIGNFFSILSTHAPAAGAAASSLGDALEALLPSLAELLGQGAETASLVLPALTAGFRGLNSVIDVTGSALPTLLSGFLAFRALQGTGRILASWSASLGMASLQGGAFSGVLGKTAGALSTVGRALPAVGVGIGLFAAVTAESEQRTNDWAAALNEGGAAARRAREEMAQTSEQLGGLTTGFMGFINSFTLTGGALNAYADDVENAKQKNREYIESLTPLERAQRDVDIATRAVADALGGEIPPGETLASLKGKLAAAAAKQAREEDRLAVATRGVTEAMGAQADAARARVDTAFGYQQALIDQQKALVDVTGAQIALDEARASGDPKLIAEAELELKEAMLGVNDALSNRVKLAGDAAMAQLPASLDETQKKALAAKAELDELNKIIAEGTVLPPEMEQYRQSLIGIAAGADAAMLEQAQLATALREVGVAVTEIPGTASIKIDAPTDEIRQRLEDLGFTVKDIDGVDPGIIVTAETEAAKANVGEMSSLLAGLDGTTATPTADLDPVPFQGILGSILQNITGLAGQRPTPQVDLNAAPYRGVDASVRAQINLLNNARPTPVVTLTDLASAKADMIRRSLENIPKNIQTSVTTTYRTVGSPMVAQAGADGGTVVPMPRQRFDDGGHSKWGQRFNGATYGRGGPRDDLVPALVSPLEHVLDARDVGLMGGQAGVYAFREMLNSGFFGGPSEDNDIRTMVSVGAPARMAATPPAQQTRDVRIFTQDNPKAIIRAMRAEQQQAAALAPAW